MRANALLSTSTYVYCDDIATTSSMQLNLPQERKIKRNKLTTDVLSSRIPLSRNPYWVKMINDLGMSERDLVHRTLE